MNDTRDQQNVHIFFSFMCIEGLMSETCSNFTDVEEEENFHSVACALKTIS